MHDVFASLAAHAVTHGARIALSDERGALGFRALAARVAALVGELPDDASTIAIAGRTGVSWCVADLAATLAGRRVVPVPGFFSPAQTRHVLHDSGARLLLSCDLPRTGCGSATDLPVLRVDGHARVPDAVLPRYTGDAERVIYTSGTTGTPKGVVHGERQMAHAIQAIAAAVRASAHDRHLSVLPASLLLEQIAGVFIPLAVGARSHLCAPAVEAGLAGDASPLLALFSRTAPSTTVLVPQLLAALVAAARTGAWTAPSSLRFAAVGGAPVPIALLRAARACGIPVIRGYGLSECASVVTVERPDGVLTDTTDGGCGPPVHGVRVSAEQGELVVRGPTVMRGYLNAAPLPAPVWRTGDGGRLGPGGTLIVSGRRDRVLVLPSGRNVCADWVEATALTDPRIAAARLQLGADGAPELTATLRAGLATAGDGSLRDALRAALADLPAYAHPARIHIARGGRVARDPAPEPR